MAINTAMAGSHALSPAEMDSESPTTSGIIQVKRGEIGYSEDDTTPVDQHDALSDPSNQPTENPRSSISPSSNTTPSPATPSNDHSCAKTFIISLFKPKNVPSWKGICQSTLIYFFLQVFILILTIVGWALSATYVGNMSPPANGSGQDGELSPSTMVIYIHVIFTLVVLFQLVLLERQIFRMRVEHYVYLHPGATLPTSHNFSFSRGMGIMPWNRPPLPSYAAAIVQRGYGTGDVEDDVIAILPPPAYGHTSGNRFLISGHLRESLRAQRPVSVHSISSKAERPHSYVCSNMEWEVIKDAEYARRLEEELSRLDEGVAM